MLVPSRMQERNTKEKHRCDGDAECVLAENMVQNPNFQSLNRSISEAATATGQKGVLRGPRDTSVQVKLDVLLPAQVITMETAGMDSSQSNPWKGGCPQLSAETIVEGRLFLILGYGSSSFQGQEESIQNNMVDRL